MLFLPLTQQEYACTRRKNRSMSMINKKEEFENDQMLRKLPSQSSELDEEHKSHHLLPNISHCDFYSVCFSLEENVELFKEKSAISLPKESSKRRESRTCNCECYLPKGSRSRQDYVVPCDSYFILETHECICRPPTSVRLAQGYPPNYFNIDKTLTTISSSYYLNVYDHIVGPKERQGYLYRTSVIPAILNWDVSMSESRIFRFEHIDYGALFYRQYFLCKEHDNFIGTDPNYGPFAISIKREILEQKIDCCELRLDGNNLCEDSHFVIKEKFVHEPNSSNLYIKNDNNHEEASYNVVFRIIARFISTYTLRIILPDIKRSSDGKPRRKSTSSRQILMSLFPKLSTTCTYMVSNRKIEQELLKFDEDLALASVHKIGIMYCGIDQKTESEMYGNVSGSPNYDKFLGLIGQTVVLKGFDGYAAMLDTASDFSGTHSVYTEFHKRKIMFHVATMLPHDPTNPQQVCKKRYIGNDVVTLIFQDEKASPFSPKSFLSQFQHSAFVSKIIKLITVFRVHDVPYFGPPISEDLIPHGEFFRQFILTKIINAEYACQKSSVFLKLATRTRFHCLMDLKKYQSSGHVEKTQLFPFKFRASTTSCFTKSTIMVAPSYLSSHCALIWSCSLDFPPLNKSGNHVICVSAYCVSIIDLALKETVLTIINKYLVAWRQINDCT
ncbi:hypothetical protein MXB_1903 [Myxobolus squamalis]|nr:hypothetical protein MXB_1903 [Myxobolus squamalis]